MSSKLKDFRNKFKKMVKSKTFSQVMLLGTGALIFLLVFCGGLFILLKPYTITFDLNDGSEPIYETYDLNDGAIHLGIPERAGYRFTGWTGDNGSKPNRDVTVGKGKIGNLSYKANWSEELIYTCQDWVIDNKGNLVKDITAEVDKFLKDGKSSKKYKVIERTAKTKKGATVNAKTWGEDKAYKVYSDRYMFVGTSGDVKIKNDETIVYRYFYPVLDVNYLVDETSPSSLEITNADVARFDLVVDGKTVASDVSDFCKAVAVGASYDIVVKDVNSRFQYEASLTDSGVMGDTRNNIDISFATRTTEGEFRVSCQDWVIDARGRRVQEITEHVDQLLSSGKNKKKYFAQERTITVNYGDEVSGELWGNDTTIGAYANGYVYVESSAPITVTGDNKVVYRYFYPVLDINASVNGQKKSNTNGFGKINVYIDGELEAENVTDFCQGVPAGSDYRIEITGYDNFEYVHPDTATDSGRMDYMKRDLALRFEPRTGSDYVFIEDWVVDASGNRIREITDEVDAYLSSDNNKGGHKLRNRTIKAEAGSIIDAGLFGNDEKRGAYSLAYMYAGSSGRTAVEPGGGRIYRYFWPVLDVNGVIDGKATGNTKDAAIFNVYVDGVMVKMNVADFCQGVPAGSHYEIGMVRPQNDYVYTEDETSRGEMTDETLRVQLILDKAAEPEQTGDGG